MAVERHIYVVGSNAAKCYFDPTATMVNTIVNASSGIVTVKECVMFGHGVQLLAGTHDVRLTGTRRQEAIPDSGYDITIERGAWIASNVTVIGPVTIGANSVVCAGSVVTRDVPPGALVGGVPAHPIRLIDLDESPPTPGS